MDNLERYLDDFRKVCPLTSGIRRAGSAALDLAYVACGRLDGFWEYGLKPWDIAAGALMITESGGVIFDFDDKEDYLQSGNILAGPLPICEELSKLLK